MSKKEIKIYNYNGNVAFTAKAETERGALEIAVKAGANLSNADLFRANLYGADLYRANLSNADLYGANLSRANLYGANLDGADLYGANLSNANLYGANLSGANLSGANLYGANLSGADLSNANLYGANLSGANLSRANLSGANLSGANLYGAKGVNPLLTTPLMILKDQVGKIRAYKLVNEDYEGPYYGGIRYQPGKTYHAKGFDEDPFTQCGKGINLASLDWCLKGYKRGYHVLLTEFTKNENKILVPVGSDGKFRVKWCKIIRELTPKELGMREKDLKSQGMRRGSVGRKIQQRSSAKPAVDGAEWESGHSL